jgi:hypothetical protein
MRAKKSKPAQCLHSCPQDIQKVSGFGNKTARNMVMQASLSFAVMGIIAPDWFRI